MKVIKDTPKSNSSNEYVDVIEYMETKYPQMTSEFKKIQQDQYELFLRKQHDYGPQNIAVGTALNKRNRNMTDQEIKELINI